ncbi:MAG: glycosyltransferase [Vicinamibacterales bacterium]
MRLLCLIPAMGPGGAERVMSRLVTHLAASHDVTLLTWESPDASSFYALPQSIRYVRADRLGGRGVRRALRVLSRPATIRRAIRRVAPDLIISFMNTMNVTALLGALGSRVPVIVSERNDPSRQHVGWTKSLLRDRAYTLARTIVVPTQRVADYFPPALRPKLRVLANPVAASTVVARPDVPGADRRMRLVSVGKLMPQKGHQDLIDAFALVAADRPEWDLVVLGEGSDREALDRRVRVHGLQGRVAMPGVVTDVARELASSHLLAFPSRYEGFPNALAEGLACGLPAVGFAGVSGVEDLIVDGRTGRLVDPREGVRGFAEALSELMMDPACRVALGEAARRHVTRWAPERIFAAWDDLLGEDVGAAR